MNGRAFSFYVGGDWLLDEWFDEWRIATWNLRNIETKETIDLLGFDMTKMEAEAKANVVLERLLHG